MPHSYGEMVLALVRGADYPGCFSISSVCRITTIDNVYHSAFIPPLLK